jgi:Tat protein translocase TatB subunit
VGRRADVFDIGPEKILVVLLVAMVFLGPERLPGMARQIGSALRELRGVRESVENEIRGVLDQAPGPGPTAMPMAQPELPPSLPESRTFE